MARSSNLVDTANLSFGHTLRQARLLRGMNQTDLAYTIGSSASMISQIENAVSVGENGRHSRTRGTGVVLVARFAAALNVDFHVSAAGEWTFTPNTY